MTCAMQNYQDKCSTKQYVLYPYKCNIDAHHKQRKDTRARQGRKKCDSRITFLTKLIRGNITYIFVIHFEIQIDDVHESKFKSRKMTLLKVLKQKHLILNSRYKRFELLLMVNFGVRREASGALDEIRSFSLYSECQQRCESACDPANLWRTFRW